MASSSYEKWTFHRGVIYTSVGRPASPGNAEKYKRWLAPQYAERTRLDRKGRLQWRVKTGGHTGRVPGWYVRAEREHLQREARKEYQEFALARRSRGEDISGDDELRVVAQAISRGSDSDLPKSTSWWMDLDKHVTAIVDGVTITAKGAERALAYSGSRRRLAEWLTGAGPFLSVNKIALVKRGRASKKSMKLFFDRQKEPK